MLCQEANVFILLAIVNLMFLHIEILHVYSFNDTGMHIFSHDFLYILSNASFCHNLCIAVDFQQIFLNRRSFRAAIFLFATYIFC